MMGSTTRAGRDQRRTVAGLTGDAGIRVVSIVSARVIAGRMVVRWRASLGLSALGVGHEGVMVKTSAARTVLPPMPQRWRPLHAGWGCVPAPDTWIRHQSGA